LYAIEPFLAVLQNGGTIVSGNPTLASEKLYQIDLGLKADYERVRLGLNGFYIWIADYITYKAIGTSQKGIDLATNLNNALAVRYVNTGLATLAGFETYGEWDATDWLTPFVTMSYVEGRDHNRADRGDNRGGPSEPLPGIAPLDTRLGLRFHEARREGPRYGV